MKIVGYGFMGVATRRGRIHPSRKNGNNGENNAVRMNAYPTMKREENKMSLPQRKRMRLKGYDYSSTGCYFVTICTHNGLLLFGNGEKLNDFGEIVDDEIQKISTRYCDVKVDNYIVMPNHIHLLITIGCDALSNDDETVLSEVTGKSEHSKLDEIIGLFKAGVSRRIHKIEDVVVWQRSYYDHIIKNEKDYNETWDYIDANPIRWKLKYNIVSLNI